MNYQCKLLSGGFALFLQFLLGCISFSSLLIKRYYYENPRRSRQIWIYDSLKQIISAVTAHIINIIIAVRITGNKQCEWYFINFFMDTFLGTIITFILVRLVNKIAKHKDLMIIHMGYYGQTLNSNIVQSNARKMFIIQTIIWTLIVVFGKIVILFGILYPCKTQFESFGKTILGPVSGSPNLELTIVMIVFPLILNTTQILLYDYLLKKKINKVILSAIPIENNYTEL